MDEQKSMKFKVFCTKLKKKLKFFRLLFLKKLLFLFKFFR
jgi:hypothetical protein